MAKEIVWTLRSIQDRIEIYQYWQKHNHSDSYSNKLESLFNITANLVSKYPEIGVRTNHESIRIKVIKSYKFFYRVLDNKLKFSGSGILIKIRKDLSCTK